jgi:hypothetical protein
MASMTRGIALKASRQTRIEELVLLWTVFATIPAGFDVSREVSAVAIAGLVVVPAVIIWLAKRRLLVAEPVIVLGIAWIAAVTLPVLLPGLYKDRMWDELSPRSLDLAALWMYRGWAACCLAYWGARLWFGECTGREASPFDLRVQVVMRRWIGVLGFLGTVSYIVFMGGHTYEILEEAAVADSTPKQITAMLKELSYAYVFLYFYARNWSKLGKIDTYLLYAVLAAQAIVFVGSGSKYSMMSLLVAWALAITASARRPGLLRELSIGATSIGAVFAISYFVATYRGELVLRPLPSPDAPVTEVVAFQFDVMITAVSNVLQGGQVGQGYYTDYDSSFVLDRFAYLSSFALVLETLDGNSPYESAYWSLIAPVFAVVPRDLFEDKPHFYDSGDFAKLNGWSYGGIGITIPGAFFWAWGYFGIIAGMAAVGIYLAWLWSRATGAHSNAFIARSIMIMSIIGLIDLGTTFQVIVVPVTRDLILLLLMRWGIRVWLRSVRLA